jgi:DNA-binding NarL/FixJ family response regulator
MGRRHEKVHHFELDLRTAKSEITRVDISPIFVSGQATPHCTIIHLLKPLKREKEAEEPFGQNKSNGDSPPLPSSNGEDSLTRREIEVFGLLQDGATTEEIANRLFISSVTVRNHIKSLFRKLNVHSRLEAVSLAQRPPEIQ